MQPARCLLRSRRRVCIPNAVVEPGGMADGLLSLAPLV